MNGAPEIQAVSFDVGGTLIDPWPSVGHVYAAVAREAGLYPADPETLGAQFRAAWHRRGAFEYTRESWAELVVRTFGGSNEDFGVDSPFFDKLYQRFVKPDVWRIQDDVIPTLEQLKASGFKLAVVSNWDDRLRPLLRNLGLDTYFDAIEVSGEIGVHKPAPEIFLRAARDLDVPVRALLHVGDSLVEDVEGAQAAGAAGILLTRGRGGEAAEINSLRLVPALLASKRG
jgi:putative hydrolase of the HAD superfamily